MGSVGEEDRGGVDGVEGRASWGGSRAGERRGLGGAC